MAKIIQTVQCSVCGKLRRAARVHICPKTKYVAIAERGTHKK